jgi:hypothetical protein
VDLELVDLAGMQRWEKVRVVVLAFKVKLSYY